MASKSTLGGKAEEKIKIWLNKPEVGYCFDRIPDQMTGFFGSSNICDFTLFVSPNMYYIESKATENDRFDFSVISDNQRNGLLIKSKINHVYGLVIVLFATYQRAFILDINDILSCGAKSINIKKIDKWVVPYIEIPTVHSRKQLLDYTGDFVSLVDELFTMKGK